MKLFLENRLLSAAFGVSLAVHGMLLAVRFTAPEAFNLKPADPGLEVILVNAKHDRAPLKADALAQANLDGGGNADSGRSKSPLPDSGRHADGDSATAMQRRIEQLEEQQRMLAQLSKKSPDTLRAPADAVRERQARPQQGTDANETQRELTRQAAEIARRIEDENKRPKKTFISPSTRQVGYAMYFKSVSERIEKFGTLNFPQHNGRKLYGELTVSISIFQDGRIYDKDPNQGITIDRSSGNTVLDEAARRIVRQSAPFGAFPNNMRTSGKDDVWVMTTRFKFTRDGELETEMRGGPG
ncbi:MAG TPA: TonB family protein [Noviherbaspirillum sp.]|nr:TonB family protein [Noviherbaspirillum sp.]